MTGSSQTDALLKTPKYRCLSCYQSSYSPFTSAVAAATLSISFIRYWRGMTSWWKLSSGQHHPPPSRRASEIPTQVKSFVNIFSDIESHVGGNKESLWLLCQECDDLKRFVVDNERVMTTDPTKALVVHEIMDLLSRITKRMEKWTKSRVYLAALMKRDIHHGRRDIACARERFQTTYAIDIPKQSKQSKTKTDSVGDQTSTFSATHDRNVVDERNLNPTRLRMNARCRRSSLSTDSPSPLRANVHRRLPSNSNMNIHVEQFPSSPVRNKRKASDDEMQNKRQKLSAEAESPMRKQLPGRIGGDASEEPIPLTLPGIPDFIPRAPHIAMSDSSSSTSSVSSVNSAFRGLIHKYAKDPTVSHTKLPAPHKHDPHEMHGKGLVQGVLHLHHKDFHDLYDELDVPETNRHVQSGTAKRVADKVVVAVKRVNVLRLHSTILHRFIEEFNDTHTHHHPNLVNYWHTFWHKNSLLIVMDHIKRAVSLRNLIDVESSRMDEPQISGILRHVTQALVYLHQKNVPHGKLDSRNITLSIEGDVSVRLSLCAMLADHENLELPDIRHDITSDIWNLGVLALEMLDRSTRSLTPKRSKVQRTVFGLNPRPSHEMNDFLTKTLEVDTAQRASAAELLRFPLLAETSLFFVRVPVMNALRSPSKG